MTTDEKIAELKERYSGGPDMPDPPDRYDGPPRPYLSDMPKRTETIVPISTKVRSALGDLLESNVMLVLFVLACGIPIFLLFTSIGPKLNY